MLFHLLSGGCLVKNIGNFTPRHRKKVTNIYLNRFWSEGSANQRLRYDPQTNHRIKNHEKEHRILTTDGDTMASYTSQRYHMSSKDGNDVP